MKRTFTSETESYQSKEKLSVKGKLPVQRKVASKPESYQSKGKLSVKGKLPVQRKVASKPESYQSEVPLPAKRTLTRETASYHSNGQSKKKKLPVERKSYQ
jgi:hypothetical protein